MFCVKTNSLASLSIDGDLHVSSEDFVLCVHLTASSFSCVRFLGRANKKLKTENWG